MGNYTDKDNALSTLMEKGDKLALWLGDNTLGRLNAPLQSEEKSEMFVQNSTAILRATTGKDVGGQLRLQAMDKALSGNRKQKRKALGDLATKGIQVPTIEKCEEKDLWRAAIALLMLPFLFLFNLGPFNNKEVTDIVTKGE